MKLNAIQKRNKSAPKQGLNSTRSMPLEHRSQFAEEVSELGRLLTECVISKEEALKAYSEDSQKADSRLIGLRTSITKAKTRYESLQREHENLKGHIRNLKKAYAVQSTPQAAIAAPIDSSDVDLQYRILRKLNQDSSYALNQLKEAIMDIDENYD